MLMMMQVLLHIVDAVPQLPTIYNCYYKSVLQRVSPLVLILAFMLTQAVCASWQPATLLYNLCLQYVCSFIL